MLAYLQKEVPGFKRLWVYVQLPRFRSVLKHKLAKKERQAEEEYIAQLYLEIAGKETSNFAALAEAFLVCFQARNP